MKTWYFNVSVYDPNKPDTPESKYALKMLRRLETKKKK